MPGPAPLRQRGIRWGFVLLLAVPAVLVYVLSGCVAVGAGTATATGPGCSEAVTVALRYYSGISVSGLGGDAPVLPSNMTVGATISMLEDYGVCAPPPGAGEQACLSACVHEHTWYGYECASTFGTNYDLSCKSEAVPGHAHYLDVHSAVLASPDNTNVNAPTADFHYRYVENGVTLYDVQGVVGGAKGGY